MTMRVSKNQGGANWYIAEHERKLRRHARGSNGAIGFATYVYTQAETAALGGSALNFTGHWALGDDVGDHRTALVSGMPTYNDGLYLIQIVPSEIDFGDGSPLDDEMHVVQWQDGLIGAFHMIAATGLFLPPLGLVYYTATPVASDLSLSYISGPSGATADLTILNGTSLFVTRLGDVPA